MTDDGAKRGMPQFDAPDRRKIRSLSPEARRRRAKAIVEQMDFAGGLATETPRAPAIRDRISASLRPGARPFEVIKRTIVGTYNDGFIHAGNLAYLSMLAIFPFFILSGFLFELFGEADERQAIIETVLAGTPPTVRDALSPVAQDAIEARSGWLLWLGAGVGLWTVSSLVESIRDILRRAYGTSARYAFWKYRLLSSGFIIGAVVLLLLSLFAQVAINTAMQVIDTRAPMVSETIGTLQLTRMIPAISLFGSMYLLFLTLTPEEYRDKRYPKWPGAFFTAAWWVGVTMALPPVLSAFFAYDLTYGSLAGIMVALFFFWLVGLGLVIGAELNAALAEPLPESSAEPGAGHSADTIDHSDDAL